jgi:drug/metabolite transporter (DMT)-like permease
MVMVAVVAALLGTALLVSGVDHRAQAIPVRGWIAGAGAAVSFAFYILYSKRGLATYPPETVLFYTFVVAAAFWAIITPPTRIVAAGYDRTLWGMFVALGIFSTLVPFVLFYAGLRRLPPEQAGIVATMEPVIAVISAAAFLGESLRPLQWLGAVMVLGAAVLASLEPHSPAEVRAELR